MEHLIGKTLPELAAVVQRVSLPAYTAKQIASWLYRKRVRSIDEMTDISLAGRQRLKDKFIVGCIDAVKEQKSKDGTRKYLFAANNGKSVETVFIPEKERATLCVSSQVGCKMNCLFCMTGKHGFSGELSSSEIMNQILSVPNSETLTNIVFMGMGEPFDNIGEVFRVLEILVSDYGFCWSPKRITVSSVGLVPGLKRFLDESRCHLAISVHSPFHEERLKLVPAEKAFPIADIVAMLRERDFSHQRRVSFEYILFGGMNDNDEHASALVRMLRGMECRVNLIRYHAIPSVNLPATREDRMMAFRDFLNSYGITATIRASRGEDIFAACGMLSTKNKNQANL
ncbi:MAG: 23S rRNA (adenine(2503)-C(2))-methyltransferase RlmN [Dysgonamonadaceae bacterium]|jgi:23S rRNA (adenine2503-C2)-methyltransferase|nr:23S rRNA (adenine(2503)-C(2))-methyltransferase RlmN [Dysgonamonadaceae bacterium]